MRWRPSVLLWAWLVVLFTPGAWADDAAADGTDEPLRVAMCDLRPFVYWEGERWQGFAVELWEEVADEMDRTWVGVEGGQIRDVLRHVAGKDVDLGLCGTSVTVDRQFYVQFSMPYFRSGLQMMVVEPEFAGWTVALRVLTSRDVRMVLSGVGGLWLLMVLLHWRLANTATVGALARAGAALSWGISMWTWGGPRDHVRHPVLRAALVAYTISMVLSLGYLSARLTSDLMLEREHGHLHDPAMLVGKTVAVPLGTTSDTWVTASGAVPQRHPSFETAVRSLRQGRADALVFDAPVLQHFVIRNPDAGVRLAGSVFREEDYGFTASDADLLEHVNRALLQLKEDGTYDRLYAKWFR